MVSPGDQAYSIVLPKRQNRFDSRKLKLETGGFKRIRDRANRFWRLRDGPARATIAIGVAKVANIR